MKVRAIEMHNFTCHKQTCVELPERGVVLVTGANGSGKSSLIEAVSVAGWGKTLRGTVPWPRTGAGRVVVRTSEATLTRDSRNRLTLDDQRYDTAVKAQAALAEHGVLLDRDVWQHGHVFSAADMTGFAASTDGERKRLLEAMVGPELRVFDAGLLRCRQDLREAQARLAEASHQAAVQAERLRGVEARLEDATEAVRSEPQAEPPTPVKKEQLIKAREQLRVYREALVGVEQELEERFVPPRLALPDEARCPVCTQPIREAHRAKVHAKHERNVAAANEARRPLLESRDKLREHVRKAEEKLQQLTEAYRDWQAAHEQHERRKRAHEHLRKLRTEAADARDCLEELQGLCRAREQRVARLRAAETVLGLEGARVRLLGQALHGIEALTNTWLGRMAAAGDAPLSISLQPATEKKSGGMRDAIALAVEGAGEGYGYRASSSGERRRLDVAIMLAHAELASSAHKQEGGTLFFDEVFDHIDADGVLAISEFIEELAEERCIVVISHQSNVLRALKPALHLRFAQGRLV